MNRSPRSRAAPIAASFAAVLALGLAACGGDDDDADTTTPATDVTSPADTAGGDTVTPGTDVESTPGSDGESSTPGSGSAAGEVGTEEEYVAAASEAIGWEDTDVSDCVAGVLVEAIGYDQIQDAGVTVEEFSAGSPSTLGLTVEESAGADISSDVAGCGDIIEQLATANQMSDEQQSCISDNLDNDQMSELLVTQFFTLTPRDGLTEASDAVDACISELTSTSVAS